MRHLLIAMISVCFLSHAWAQNATAQQSETLLDIQHQWSHINYQVSDKDQKISAFNQLASKIDGLLKAQPNNADYLTWLGITQASTAAAKGGLGALSYAKDARKNLEQAISINPKASEGSANMTLGVLYHKVPGWPVSFGSDSKAKALLQTALKMHPKSLDANFFYASFLYDEGEYKAAKQHLDVALKAAPRPNRPIADKGRRDEINTLMAQVNKKQ